MKAGNLHIAFGKIYLVKVPNKDGECRPCGGESWGHVIILGEGSLLQRCGFHSKGLTEGELPRLCCSSTKRVRVVVAHSCALVVRISLVWSFPHGFGC